MAWELANGPIPDGMLVCHHCDNPPCCNVAHLFLGTHADNTADMMRKGRQRGTEQAAAYWLAKTHCPHGHAYDEANTYIDPKRGARLCRACRAQRKRLSQARKRAG